jgi:anti-sigma B factor antagonist
MEIDRQDRQNNVVLSLNGDFDYNSVKSFNDIVSELIEKKTPRIVIVMKELAHIDSMGLGAITKLWKNADRLGFSIVLADVPKNILNLIKLVNLDRRIMVFDNLDEALG